MRWSASITSCWPRAWRQQPLIPDDLWENEVAQLPFLHPFPATAHHRLRLLSAHFLAEKEFFGAHGLRVTDSMALAVAIQACLPLLGFSPPEGKFLHALDWYGDFVTIVLHPSAALAQRRVTDEAGVVHQFQEPLIGEAMAGGPVMLSWADVTSAHHHHRGHNVVIHEFIHKIDMRHRPLGEEPQGMPWLPAGFMGLGRAAAKQHWLEVMQDAFNGFAEQVSAAERFAQPTPWLDAYGATSIAEFFAVSCEAYFVQRVRFAQEFAALARLYDRFFDPHAWLHRPLTDAPALP